VVSDDEWGLSPPEPSLRCTVDEPGGKVAHRRIGVLRNRRRHREGARGVDAEPLHDNALGLSNDVTGSQRGPELALVLVVDERNRGTTYGLVPSAFSAIESD
jgi:hypothetical protein